jgi:hypothetical protein
MSNLTAAAASRTAGGRVVPLLYDTLKRYAVHADRRLRTTDRFHFEDRRPASTATLVCLLAGRNREMQPFVLPPFATATKDFYVCVVTPGFYDDGLSAVCAARGWSYLAIRTRDFGLAQNICYRLHPDAEEIVKINDDIFVPPGTVAALVERLRKFKRDGIFNPGLVAPLITSDGVCYRHLLEALGLLGDFERTFGTARVAASGLTIDTNRLAALWLWERIAPVARTAEIMASRPEHVLYAPVSFSAGMIAFERSFWEESGYFPVYRRRLMVGRDKPDMEGDYLCARAQALSRPVLISSQILAGRFASDLQSATTAELLRSRPELFKV